MRTGNGTKDARENALEAVRRGFTLIEVMTAVALTAGLMLGVIEIFKMSSDAASQTEQASDAFEMGRGVMAQLESDLSMYAPEGYFWARCQEMIGGGGGSSYRFDGLAFSVALASPTAGQLAYLKTDGTTSNKTNPVTNSSLGWPAGGQVAYTFGQRSYSGSTTPYMGTLNNSDQRGVVLVRKVYLDQFSPLKNNGIYSGLQVCLGQVQTDTGHAYITNSINNYKALTQNTLMAQAATEYLSNPTPNNWVLAPNFRLSPASYFYAISPTTVPAAVKDVTNGQDWQPVINVPDPSATYVAGGAVSNQYLSELDNIVCDRVSEFFVEVWNGQKWVPNLATLGQAAGGTGYMFNSTGTQKPNYIPTTGTTITQGSGGGSWGAGGGGGYWQATVGAGAVSMSAISESAVTLLRDNMLWLGTAANPLNRYDVTWPSGTASDLPPATIPSMVRVTLVVHPHADRSPLASELYYGGNVNRYQGVVFREIFKLSGTNR